MELDAALDAHSLPDVEQTSKASLTSENRDDITSVDNKDSSESGSSKEHTFSALPGRVPKLDDVPEKQLESPEPEVHSVPKKACDSGLIPANVEDADHQVKNNGTVSAYSRESSGHPQALDPEKVKDCDHGNFVRKQLNIPPEAGAKIHSRMGGSFHHCIRRVFRMGDVVLDRIIKFPTKIMQKQWSVAHAETLQSEYTIQNWILKVQPDFPIAHAFDHSPTFDNENGQPYIIKAFKEGGCL